MTAFNAQADQPATTAYGFSFHALMGPAELPLAAYKGKVIMVVNTASHCGFTSQYQGLEKIYKTFEGRGFVIIGLPSNDFGAQEPGSGEQIAEFCKLNYGVSFPMASKEVVSGNDAHPFYRWARDQDQNMPTPQWNFHKYLIDRHGALIGSFPSGTRPDDPRLIAEIEKLLKETE